MSNRRDFELSPMQKRRALKFEIKHSVGDAGITEAYLYIKYYKSEDGREYWASWLTSELEDFGSCVELLAAHNAKNSDFCKSQEEIKFAYLNKAFHRPIYEAVIDAAKRGEPWLRGDTSALINGKFENSDYARSVIGIIIQVDRLAMFKWLLNDPNYSYLVPKVAAEILKDENPAHKDQMSITTARNKGGAPTKYNWAAAGGALGAYFYTRGIPTRDPDITDADVVRWLEEWFTKNHPNRCPDKRDIERFVGIAVKTANEILASD